jgi:hypothetical protein
LTILFDYEDRVQLIVQLIVRSFAVSVPIAFTEEAWETGESAEDSI